MPLADDEEDDGYISNSANAEPKNFLSDLAIVTHLKESGLYDFVLCPSKESSINVGVHDQGEEDEDHLRLILCENEKWRPMIKQWGSVKGVHLFAWDRHPYTDESGLHNFIGGSYKDVKPIQGFKWKDSEWAPVIDESTDELGYQFARKWSDLNSDTRQTKCSEELKVLFLYFILNLCTGIIIFNFTSLCYRHERKLDDEGGLDA